MYHDRAHGRGGGVGWDLAVRPRAHLSDRDGSFDHAAGRREKTEARKAKFRFRKTDGADINSEIYNTIHKIP